MLFTNKEIKWHEITCVKNWYQHQAHPTILASQNPACWLSSDIQNRYRRSIFLGWNQKLIHHLTSRRAASPGSARALGAAAVTWAAAASGQGHWSPVKRSASQVSARLRWQRTAHITTHCTCRNRRCIQLRQMACIRQAGQDGSYLRNDYQLLYLS